MKKTVKGLLIVMIMTMVLATLTGCGDSEEKTEKSKKSDNNTLVATKVEEDVTLGKYEERIEVTFEKDVAKAVTIKMSFEDEEDAEGAESMLKYLSELSDDISFERDGKAVIANMSVEAFIGSDEVKEEELTKEAFKKDLEESGYTIEE